MTDKGSTLVLRELDLIREDIAQARAELRENTLAITALGDAALVAHATELLHWLEWALQRVDPAARGDHYDRAQALVEAAKRVEAPSPTPVFAG